MEKDGGQQELPHSLEAEAAVLAGVLHDPSQLDTLGLTPGDFYHAMHRDIFRAMLALSRDGKPITWVHMYESLVGQPGSGEAGSEALMRRSMMCQASSYIPAADSSTHFSLGNIFHSSGPNGGGVMRGDSVAGMWPTLEVVRDIYSNASVGVVLTWIALWDAAVAFRASAYRRAAFQIAA